MFGMQDPPQAKQTTAWLVFQMVVRPHILAMACLTSVVFGWLFSNTFMWGVAALVAADWFVVNLLNRVVDLAEDAHNGVPGTAFLARHGRVVTAVTFLFLLAAVVGGHVLYPALTPWRCVFHVIGLAYNYKLIPWPGGLTRFKEMYGLKNTSSAALFVISDLVLPLVHSGQAADPLTVQRALMLLWFFFPLELTYEILFDLRDVDGDRRERVPTFPAVHGAARAWRICAALLALSAVAPLVAYLVGVFRIRDAVLALGVVQQALLLRWAWRNGPTGARVVNVTWMGAAQLASYVVWVVAGLPVFDA